MVVMTPMTLKVFSIRKLKVGRKVLIKTDMLELFMEANEGRDLRDKGNVKAVTVQKRETGTLSGLFPHLSIFLPLKQGFPGIIVGKSCDYKSGGTHRRDQFFPGLSPRINSMSCR